MNTELTHETDDDGNRLISVSGLRVLVGQDRNGLFCAQGLEIDYAAGGDSLEEVKANFVKGLCETITAQIDVIGDFSALLKQAPQDVWDQFFALTGEEVHVSQHAFEPPGECFEMIPGFMKTVDFYERRGKG